MASARQRAHHRGMRTFIVAMGLVALALPVQAADEEGNLKPGSEAAQFMSEAATANLAEQDLGKLAEDRAQNARVKEYARRMVDDHKDAQDKLESIASDKGVSLPSRPNAEQQRVAERLKGLEGAAFDRAYMDAMRDDHQKVVKKFEQASQSVRDPRVKQYATDTLPHLRAHLKMAQDISGSLSKAASGAGARD
jgi:putative membrane protein